uniref:Codanin-1 C-terminal domain-containing protein n=1 Tax=Anopheles maculatus TaxID=74869 RepID=A0A182TCG8_9DIPT
MLLSFTSTPIAGIRGKTTAQHGSSRNGSLEVSSPNTAGNGSQRQEASGLSDGGGTIGRRKKTSLPCLGDYIVMHTTKPHRNRRSPFTNNNSGSNNEPSGLNSSSTLNSPMFQNDDFPELNVTPSKDQTGNDDSGHSVKKRISINSTTSFNESHDGSVPGVSSGKKSGNQRRRIAPTTVSRTVSGRHDFNSSSFRSENNLVSIQSLEDAGPDPRRMLRSLKDEIRSDFLQAEKAQVQRNVRAKQSLHTSFNQVDTVFPATELDTSNASDLVQADDEKEVAKQLNATLIIEFDKVTHKPTIDRLVTIYALLMDLNLMPNMLNELAYLINLVSTERYIAPVPQKQPETTSADNTPAELCSVLRSPHNCVYFATEVLYHQRTLLALLDSTSLRVVVENEQLEVLHPTLNGFLRDMLAQKMKLENPFINQASSGGDLLLNNSITNVFYQQENDTKDHFPSSKEFSAFNKQRDLFYTALRVWETEHLNPTWEFKTKLGSKVQAILDVLYHPINMSHLAKLFSAQLIISFNFDVSMD